MSPASIPQFAASIGVQLALKKWVAMRTQLVKSVQEYLSACNTLSAACSRLVHLSLEGPAVEDALVVLDSELNSLAAEEDTLRNTRFSLLALRNRSATLAPINSLPLEILVNIFALIGPSCAQSRAFSCIFAGVCTYWRKLSLDTPYLWSHIDVGPNVPRGLSNFLLERAKDSPLHVHACEPKYDLFKDDETCGPRYAEQVVEILTPHVHRISTLRISSDSWQPDFAERVVIFWLGHGNSDLTRSLMMHQPAHLEPLPLLPQTLANAEKVLLSLRTLRLGGAIFNWESGAYRGLVDLQIGFTSCKEATSDIHVSKLACILTASPTLVVLKLGNLVILHTDNQPQPAPVTLNCLKVLNIVEMPADSLQLLLPLIRLPRDYAELSVGIGVYEQIQNELEDFLDHSPITTLHCFDVLFKFRAWPSLLKSFPRLRTLVLDNFEICERIPSSGASPILSQSTSSHFPKVILLSCQLTFEGVDSLIAKLGTCDLRIEEYDTFDPEYKEDCIEIKTSLLEVYPRLQCTVSDWDSTPNLPCRLLDY